MWREEKEEELVDDPKETRWFWKLKEDALNCNVWRTDFVVRGCGPVVRQTAECVNAASLRLYAVKSSKLSCVSIQPVFG